MNLKRLRTLVASFTVCASLNAQDFEILKNSGTDKGKVYAFNENADVLVQSADLSGTFANATPWQGFATDRSYYYLYNPSTGLVDRCNLGGGSRTTVFDANMIFGNTSIWKGFASDNDYYYFLCNEDGSNRAGEIVRLNKSGSANPTTIADIAGSGKAFGNIGAWRGFATDGIFFYLHNTQSGNSTYKGQIERVDYNGTRRKTICDIEPALITDNSNYQGMALPPPSLGFKLGVAEPHLVRLGTLAQEKAMIANMDNSGVKQVRLTLSHEALSDQIALIKECNSRNIEVLLQMGVGNPNLYVNGATKRPGNRNQGGNIWDAYRFTEIDIAKADTWIRGYLQDAKNAGADIEAIEVLNEINWCAFNGDLPLVEGGLILDENVSLTDPIMVDYVAGLDKVGRLMQKVHSAIGDIYNGNIDLVTAGLVEIEEADFVLNSGGSRVSQKVTLQVLQGSHPQQSGAPNYLSIANGIGVHIYPSTVDLDPATAITTALASIDLTCHPLVDVVGTSIPFWVTECGYRRGKFGSGEVGRHDQFVFFLRALEAYDQQSGNANIGPTFLFAFSRNDDHKIYDSGLLKSGEVLKQFDY